METDAANMSELTNTAREVGAAVIEGTVSYPSGMGCWRIGDLDFCEHLDTYRGRRVVVIIADCGDAGEQPEEYTCGSCRFVMNEARECPRCKMRNERGGNALDERERGRGGLWDDLFALFDGGLSNDD